MNGDGWWSVSRTAVTTSRLVARDTATANARSSSSSTAARATAPATRASPAPDRASEDVDEVLGAEQRVAQAQVGPDALLDARDHDDVPLRPRPRPRSAARPRRRRRRAPRGSPPGGPATAGARGTPRRRLRQAVDELLRGREQCEHRVQVTVRAGAPGAAGERAAAPRLGEARRGPEGPEHVQRRGARLRQGRPSRPQHPASRGTGRRSGGQRRGTRAAPRAPRRGAGRSSGTPPPATSSARSARRSRRSPTASTPPRGESSTAPSSASWSGRARTRARAAAGGRRAPRAAGRRCPPRDRHLRASSARRSSDTWHPTGRRPPCGPRARRRAGGPSAGRARRTRPPGRATARRGPASSRSPARPTRRARCRRPAPRISSVTARDHRPDRPVPPHAGQDHRRPREGARARCRRGGARSTSAGVAPRNVWTATSGSASSTSSAPSSHERVQEPCGRRGHLLVVVHHDAAATRPAAARHLRVPGAQGLGGLVHDHGRVEPGTHVGRPARNRVTSRYSS